MHAVVGLRHGHKGRFETVALALGFTRPLTHASEPSDTLKAWLEPMLAKIGPIPHASLRWSGDGPRVKRRGGGMVPDGDDEPVSSRPKKQTRRMKKCECLECGYTVRVTAKWLEVGMPHCPHHGAMQTPEELTEAA